MKYSERWKCPECGHSVTLFVKPSTAPTCSNPESHMARTYEMLPMLRRKTNQPH